MTLTSAWRAAPLISLACALNACVFDDIGEAIGEGFGCAFDVVGNGSGQIAGDEGELFALVDCEPGVDCAQVRTVARGASFEIAITRDPDSDATFDTEGVRIESSDPRVLELEGFTPQGGTCDSDELQGRATFRESGEAAIVVYRGEVEIDRFTATAAEVVSAELQENPTWPNGAWTPVGERVVVRGTLHGVRVLARSADGARLIGAKPIAMSIDDSDVAVLDTGATGIVLPQKIGKTTLRAQVAHVDVAVELEVVSLPAAGGVELSDASVEDEE